MEDYSKELAAAVRGMEDAATRLRSKAAACGSLHDAFAAIADEISVLEELKDGIALRHDKCQTCAKVCNCVRKALKYDCEIYRKIQEEDDD